MSQSTRTSRKSTVMSRFVIVGRISATILRRVGRSFFASQLPRPTARESETPLAIGRHGSSSGVDGNISAALLDVLSCSRRMKHQKPMVFSLGIWGHRQRGRFAHVRYPRRSLVFEVPREPPRDQSPRQSACFLCRWSIGRITVTRSTGAY